MAVRVDVGSNSGRTLFAVVLIALGILWTLDSLELLESEPLLRWWPLLVVVFGVSRILGIGTRAQTGAGTVITLVGAWMLGNSLDLFDVGIWDLWPLALVAVGVSLIVRARRPPGQPEGVAETGSTISNFAFWSGFKRPVTSQEFKGGDLSAIMGGIETDLRGARIGSTPAVLDMLVIWGGIDLRVPEDWKIEMEATVIMGGIDHKGKVPPTDASQTLILRGFVLMGGVDIKN